MSAPISPGGVTRPSDTISVTATTSSAPASWQALASAVRSWTWPKKLGFCTTTQEVLASISLVRSSAALGIGRRGGDLEAGELAVGLDHLAIVRMEAAGQHRPVAARHAVRHHHGFGGRGRAVVHRGVGDIHAGQHAPPGSGTRTGIAACPASPPAGRACRRSGTRRAGSGDRPRPGRGGDRRRRRGSSGTIRRRDSSPPARPCGARPRARRDGAAGRPALSAAPPAARRGRARRPTARRSSASIARRSSSVSGR